MMGAPYPVFPVKLVGFRELHAAFLNESRTRGTLWDRVQEIRVSARFWQMWDSTAVDSPLLDYQRIPLATIVSWSSVRNPVGHASTLFGHVASSFLRISDSRNGAIRSSRDRNRGYMAGQPALSGKRHADSSEN